MTREIQLFIPTEYDWIVSLWFSRLLLLSTIQTKMTQGSPKCGAFQAATKLCGDSNPRYPIQIRCSLNIQVELVKSICIGWVTTAWLKLNISNKAVQFRIYNIAPVRTFSEFELLTSLPWCSSSQIRDISEVFEDLMTEILILTSSPSQVFSHS